MYVKNYGPEANTDTQPSRQFLLRLSVVNVPSLIYKMICKKRQRKGKNVNRWTDLYV